MTCFVAGSLLSGPVEQSETYSRQRLSPADGEPPEGELESVCGVVYLPFLVHTYTIVWTLSGMRRRGNAVKTHMADVTSAPSPFKTFR